MDYDGNLTDTSPIGRTMTVVTGGATTGGSAAISTAQKKFGTHSLAIEGPDAGTSTNRVGGHLHTPHHTDLLFGSGDFTIEAFIRLNVLAAGAVQDNGSVGGGYNMIASHIYLPASGTRLGWEWNVNLSNVLSFRANIDGIGWGIVGDGSTALSADTWYHVAVCREGTKVRQFLDGALEHEATTSGSMTVPSPEQTLKIGRYELNNGSADVRRHFDGYMDSFRITKAARYTTNFTVPADHHFADYVGGHTDNKYNSGVWSISESSGEGYSVNSRRKSDKWTDSVLRDITITGGNKLTPGDGYTYHVFVADNNTTTTTHTFSVARASKLSSANASVMVIGGGGSGGPKLGGGGGAGGMLFADNNLVLEDGDYVVIVGDGGVSTGVGARDNGSSSQFYHPSTPTPTRAIALGGGAGGGWDVGPGGPGAPNAWYLGLAGGSGGGTAGGSPDDGNNGGGGGGAGNQPTPSPIWTVYRGNGAPAGSEAYAGGGGGGAGGNGGVGPGDSPGGAGGAGQAIPIFPGPGMGLPAIPSNKWAAGGAGAGYPPAGKPQTDGIGGGSAPTEKDAVTNSGSGGGTGLYNNPQTGKGGSGIVIVRYSTV
jgi:hypothetical protein